MLRLAVAILCVAAAFGAPLSAELDSEWSTFKALYNKQYKQNDEIIRRLVWENNLKYIQKHNLEADREVHTYRLGINEYADLTTEEFVRQMNGYRMVNRTIQGASFLPPSNMGALPSEVDWRTKGYVTGIKNQLECGSCWAFSTTGSLEGQHFKKSGKLVSLSEQNLVDCSTKEGNHGCGGGLMDYAFQYIKVNHGIDTETSYPYEAKDDKCRFRKTDVGATDTGFTDITPRESESALQEAVATVGPISVAIDASRPSFHMYKSGIYNEPSCSSSMLDHGVLAVGYGALEGTDYWLVKNSWGESWGDKGYIKMSRNKNNQCGISTMASYPQV